MKLSDKQVEALKKIIRKHFNAFLLSTLGPDALSAEDIRELRNTGLFKKLLVDNLFLDAFIAGKSRKGPKIRLKDMLYDEWRSGLFRDILSAVDRDAIEQIEESTQHYTKKLKDNVTEKLISTILENNRESLRNYGPKISRDEAKPVDRRKLAKELEKQTKDKFRDWERVVTTELGSAYSQGAINAILEENADKDPHDIMVYMEGPLDDATCKWCKKWYHEGQSFKVYRLTDLLANGTNVGRKAADWLPVVPPMHPRCRHRLVELPQGYSLDAQGKMFFVGKEHHELNNNKLTKSLQGKTPTFSGWELEDRYTFQGMNISIENKKGSVREWKNRNGKSGKTKMHYDYGYIRNTLGSDKDHVDCYIGPNEKSKMVYVVHQLVPSTGKHDEEKVMLGFNSEEDAKEAYLKHYTSDDFFGGITAMTIEKFKEKAIGKETDIIKARGERSTHKYVRREGGPGNYKYIYKDPLTGKEYSEDKPHNPAHAGLNADQPANDFYKPVVKVVTVQAKKVENTTQPGWTESSKLPNTVNHDQHGTVSIVKNPNGTHSIKHNGGIKRVGDYSEFKTEEEAKNAMKKYIDDLNPNKIVNAMGTKRVVVKKKDIVPSRE